MPSICRFCLSYSTENMWALSDCDGIVYNNTSFSVHIPLINALPSQICRTCIAKLNDFKQFYLKVQKNEEILHRELNKGGDALNKLYEEIKNQINNEASDPKYEQNIKDTIHGLKGNDMIIEDIKHEDGIYSECGASFDSEDELPLLTVKEVNEEGIKKTDGSNLKRDGPYLITHNVNFKCLTCFENFVSQNMLLHHYNNVHKSKKTVKENMFTTQMNGDEKMYKCNKCNKSYRNVRAVNKHANIHSDENFHCKICGRTYKTVSEIIRHGRAHDGTKISCSFGCGFATVYSGALKSHERRHKEDFKYKCDTCGKSFQVKTWYEQHQNVHTGSKPYVCDICGMAFHMDRYLKAHCSAMHPEASSKKRYVCVKCSKPCGNKKALTLHLKEHGIMSSVLCDLCGKTLSSKEQLSIHRRLHMGVKPYSCSTCNKSFAKRSNLKLHQVTHSGERAHACEACGKRYGQRSTLLRHMHKHHTGNLRKCHKCDVTFKSSVELGAHQKLCSS